MLNLANHKNLFLKQKRELIELVGFESRNKYEIRSADDDLIGFAAEENKGLLGWIMRQFLGHWRSFTIHIYDSSRNEVLKVNHPFRFIFQRLEIFSINRGGYIGAIEQRFSILTKKFDVQGKSGAVILTVSSPFWRIWTFPFMKNGTQVASVQKKWSGLLSEGFTDKDNFMVEFASQNLTEEEKNLILAAGLFIDLQYFEAKASN